jgi:hypothetical protein
MILGTANFAKEYNGHRVPSEDVDKILDYCKQVGIAKLDVATAYGTETMGLHDFGRIVKFHTTRLESCVSGRDIVLAHDMQTWRQCGRAQFDGASLSARNEYEPRMDTVEIPFNIRDSVRWKGFDCQNWNGISSHWQPPRVIARSVFLKGTLLGKFSTQECILFVLSQQWIDYCVIGTDSLEQFKRTLEPFERFAAAATDDPNIIDTRRF